MRLRYSLMTFTLMGAVACAAFGAEEYHLSTQSSQEPEEISLRALIKRGPEGNPNIILTDFSLFEEYVYQKKRLSGKWTKVWVPIIPTDGDEDAAGKSAAIRAFIYSEDVGSEEEVRQRFDKPGLRGMLNPNAPTPGIISSGLIKRSLGTELSQCLIIEEGRAPAGVLKLILYSLGCVLLIGLTGGIWYLARELDKVEVEPKPEDKSQLGERKRAGEAEPVLDALPVDEAEPRPPFSGR